MAYKTRYPQSYAECVQMLHGRRCKTLAGKETTLCLVGGLIDPSTDPQGRIAIVYRGTPVVTFYASGHCLLDTGGWQSVSTARKMNAALARHRVWQHAFVWYVTQMPGCWPACVSPEGQAIGYDWRAPKRNTPGTTGGMPFKAERILITPDHGLVAEGTPLADRDEYQPYWRR